VHRPAVRGHPQDLAAQGRLVLRELRVTRLARARVEHLVRAERDPSAIVDDALGDAPQDRVQRAQLLPGRLLLVVQQAGDAVVRLGGEVRVHLMVRGERGGEGQAHQSALAARRDPRHRADHGLLAALPVDPGDGPLVARRDQQIAVGQGGQAPWRPEIVGQRGQHLYRALRGRHLWTRSAIRSGAGGGRGGGRRPRPTGRLLLATGRAPGHEQKHGSGPYGRHSRTLHSSDPFDGGSNCLTTVLTTWCTVTIVAVPGHEAGRAVG
jgi:hypothetical protein